MTDRITLTVHAPDDVVAVVQEHEAFLRRETLAESVSYGPVTHGFDGTVGEGVKITVHVAKV